MRAPPAPEEVLQRILQVAAEYEFETFVLGFARPTEYDRGQHERVFRDLKIRVGNELLRRWPGRAIEFRRPQVRFDVDASLRVEVRASPVFLAGRYRKLSREIPSSRWVHHTCHGRGCESCRYTGTLSGPSVEEIVSAVALRASGAANAFFHALGREDTDVLMLGNGRPFILELQAPRRRSLDAIQFADQVNKEGRNLAEVLFPALVDRSQVRALKQAVADKTYRAWVEFDGEPPRDTRSHAQSLCGRAIHQYSPTRVMHRRGRRRLRIRNIIESRWLGELDGRFVWEVRAQSGTYLKELVTGDDGRTSPSLSELLGIRAHCVALDVLEVHWRGPWEGD